MWKKLKRFFRALFSRTSPAPSNPETVGDVLEFVTYEKSRSDPNSYFLVFEQTNTSEDMKFYLNIPDELVEHVENLNSNQYELGTESFSTFYPEHGYFILESMIEQHPEFLEFLDIVSDQNETFTVLKFLEHLEDLNVITQR